MKLTLTTLSAILLFFLSSCIKEEPTVSFSPIEQEIYERINAYRLVNDLPEMLPSFPVQEQALKHATDMANGDAPFSSEGFSDQRALAIKRQIRGSDAAENIAKELSTASEVVNFWRQDELSNSRLLGDFNLIGISSKQSESGVYFHVLILFRRN